MRGGGAHRLGLGAERHGQRRRAEPVVGADEEDGAEPLFEQVDVAPDGRLRQPQAPRRAGQAAVPQHRGEGAPQGPIGSAIRFSIAALRS